MVWGKIFIQKNTVIQDLLDSLNVYHLRPEMQGPFVFLYLLFTNAPYGPVHSDTLYLLLFSHQR